MWDDTQRWTQEDVDAVLKGVVSIVPPVPFSDGQKRLMRAESRARRAHARFARWIPKDLDFALCSRLVRQPKQLSLLREYYGYRDEKTTQPGWAFWLPQAEHGATGSLEQALKAFGVRVGKTGAQVVRLPTLVELFWLCTFEHKTADEWPVRRRTYLSDTVLKGHRIGLAVEPHGESMSLELLFVPDGVPNDHGISPILFHPHAGLSPHPVPVPAGAFSFSVRRGILRGL
jgi:hypothetical protein